MIDDLKVLAERPRPTSCERDRQAHKGGLVVERERIEHPVAGVAVEEQVEFARRPARPSENTTRRPSCGPAARGTSRRADRASRTILSKSSTLPASGAWRRSSSWESCACASRRPIRRSGCFGLDGRVERPHAVQRLEVGVQRHHGDLDGLVVAGPRPVVSRSTAAIRDRSDGPGRSRRSN